MFNISESRMSNSAPSISSLIAVIFGFFVNIAANDTIGTVRTGQGVRLLARLVGVTVCRHWLLGSQWSNVEVNVLVAVIALLISAAVLLFIA